MKHLLFVIISLLRGNGLTLLCCVIGGGFVQLSLFLARLVVDDGGGDTLLVPFTIINTVLHDAKPKGSSGLEAPSNKSEHRR